MTRSEFLPNGCATLMAELVFKLQKPVKAGPDEGEVFAMTFHFYIKAVI